MKKEKKIIEKGVRTILQTIQPDIINFINKPNDIFKKIEYNKYKEHNTYHSDIYETPTYIYYSKNTYNVKKYKDTYLLKSVKKKGFSYNKDTKKIYIWFGGTIDVAIVYIRHRYKWVKDYLTPYLTKSIIEKIISGKIKSPTELCKYYLKVNRIKFSPKIFYRIISQFGIAKNYLLKIIYLALPDDLSVYNYIKNLFVEKITASNIIYDDYDLFDKKVNYNWSVNRIINENKKQAANVINFKFFLNETETENETVGLESVYNDPNIKLPINSLWVKDKNHLRSLYVKYDYYSFIVRDDTKNRLYVEIDDIYLVELCYDKMLNKVVILNYHIKPNKNITIDYYNEIINYFL